MWKLKKEFKKDYCNDCYLKNRLCCGCSFCNYCIRNTDPQDNWHDFYAPRAQYEKELKELENVSK